MSSRPTRETSGEQLRPAELEAVSDRIAVLEHVVGQLGSRLDAAVSDLVSSSARAHNAEAACKVLSDRMDTLQFAVAHGIEHVERTENRIKATVARARRELADSGVEHPGLEAEAGQLSLIDARSGESRPVQAVSEAVDTDPVADAKAALLGRLRAIGLSR